jgi:hypothetical protein
MFWVDADPKWYHNYQVLWLCLLGMNLTSVRPLVLTSSLARSNWTLVGVIRRLVYTARGP